MTSPPFDQLTVYGQSDSLLFQFILAEFLMAAPEVHTIDELCTGISSSPEPETDLCLARLTNAVTTLTGASGHEEEAFPWAPTKGALGKLKHYCQLYKGKTTQEQGQIADLKSHVSRAYHAILQARELIPQVRSPVDAQRGKADSIHLDELLSEVVLNTQVTSEILMDLIHRYERDENVLYFLLRHRQEFDDVYRMGATLRLFETMFKGGMAKAHAFLTKQYSERGFYHILAHIDRYIEELGSSIV